VDSEKVEAETRFISQYGFLLKHHPLLANLRGGPVWSHKAEASLISSLRADRVIESGQELFLSFEEHPQQHLDFFSYPTLDDYELADDIVRDEIRTQRRGAATRKVGKMSAGGGESRMAYAELFLGEDTSRDESNRMFRPSSQAEPL
jgi:hypothetical protein